MMTRPGWFSSFAFATTVACATSTTRQVCESSSPTSVDIILVDANDAPVAQEDVLVANVSTPQSFRGTSDATGRVRLVVPEGRYVLVVADGYPWKRIRVEVAVRNGCTTVVRARMTPGAIAPDV